MATKARAYADQARSDYDAYVASGNGGESPVGEHHRLQLLQMAVEKLAKAFLYHAEPTAQHPHHVILSAVNRIRTHAVAGALGMELRTLVRALDAARPTLMQIEADSPSVGPDGRGLTRDKSERTANVEYPWQSDENDPTSWVAPAAHAFGVVRDLRHNSRSVSAVRLLDRLIYAADVVLPKP